MFILVVIPNVFHASNNALYSIESTAVIHKDGTVEISQDWEYDDSETSGTEHFIHLNALYGEESISTGDVTITNYQVLLNNQPMTLERNWDVNDSYTDKMWKYGYVEVGNGVELTFGITEKSQNTFTIQYTVHNALKETSDGQKYLHWSFTPTDLLPQPEQMSVTIRTEDDSFKIDKMYGFNYSGDIHYIDEDLRDAVYARMDTGTYTPDTTMNLFVSLKDEDNRISNTVQTGQTSGEKLDEMLADSDYDNPGNTNNKRSILGVILTIVSLLFTLVLNALFLFIPFGLVAAAIYKSVLPNVHMGYLIKNIDKESLDEIENDTDFYRRDKPDKVMEFYPLIQGALKIAHEGENVLMYHVSKWTSEGVFEYISEEETPRLNPLSKKTTIDVLFKLHPEKIKGDASEFELSVFELFNTLTGADGYLNTRELDKLNVEKLERLTHRHISGYDSILRSQGYIVGEKKEAYLTDEGVEILLQHAGLRNYLRDFTLINERGSSEIELWDYYFHMAALYGIADKFEKELEQIPKLSSKNQETYSRYYGTSGTARMNRHVNRAVQSSYSSYRAQQARRSSGGGGRSSSGGGRGSSGGGRGGGTR